MRILSLAFLLCIVMLCSKANALMVGNVDGNKIYYSPSTSFEIDNTFQYAGSYRSSYESKGIDMVKTATHLLTYEVFVKIDPARKEVVELFIACWDRLPTKWNYLPKGDVKEKLYPFNVNRFAGLADFLKSKGFTAAKAFHGGVMKGYNEGNTSTLYYFAVAYTTIPANIEENEYVRQRFAASVR